MTLLPSISPANKVMSGNVTTLPPVNVTEPSALRKPSEMADMVYVPVAVVKPKVPSALAVPEPATELSGLSKTTMTGLLASTFPVTVPVVGTGVAEGVKVNVGVGDSLGVDVNVGVGVSVGAEVSVGVADSNGVDVGVADSTGVGVDVGVADSTGVGVAVFPRTVRPAGDEEMEVRTLSPLETRA